ncbi:MAG: helix-turn-helix transcriptional regulator [Cytophagales bacterium]|jgi:DNA-binding HxlR family transcriptional regulator|nr:helix-turn-helix transcriptional regulator [Cytophagales bacterium]
MRDKRFRSSECPMTRAVGQIGNKWKPIIVNLISKRTLRFGQLDALVPLVTRKVLTEQLKELVEDDILKRVSYSETPPRVEYSLTDKGLALLPIFKSIVEWNLAFEKKIKKR